MGRVKAGLAKGEVLVARGAEDFTVDTPDRKSRLSVPSSPWDWASKVNEDRKGGGRGLAGFKQR